MQLLLDTRPIPGASPDRAFAWLPPAALLERLCQFAPEARLPVASLLARRFPLPALEAASSPWHLPRSQALASPASSSPPAEDPGLAERRAYACLCASLGAFDPVYNAAVFEEGAGLVEAAAAAAAEAGDDGASVFSETALTALVAFATFATPEARGAQRPWRCCVCSPSRSARVPFRTCSGLFWRSPH